jgi:hypothetical protein
LSEAPKNISPTGARYDPAFYGNKRRKDYEKLLLHRSCKVLVHETAFNEDDRWLTNRLKWILENAER